MTTIEVVSSIRCSKCNRSLRIAHLVAAEEVHAAQFSLISNEVRRAEHTIAKMLPERGWKVETVVGKVQTFIVSCGRCRDVDAPPA